MDWSILDTIVALQLASGGALEFEYTRAPEHQTQTTPKFGASDASSREDDNSDDEGSVDPPPAHVGDEHFFPFLDNLQ